MSARDGLLPVRLTGAALAPAGGGALTQTRLTRQTALALAQIEHRSIVAEAAVTARLIGQATHASMRTSAAIHSEAVLLAQLAPAAADALAQIAASSMAGLNRIVLDASE